MEFESQFIQIGNIQIRYYGIIIVSAMLVATVIAARLAEKRGRDPEHVYGALTWAIIPGIILARLWFVLFPPQSVVDAGRDTAWFLENFFNVENGAIAIWSGGLSIFGAVLGGLIGALIYMRRNDLPVAPWLDIAAVVLPLGQAIGRWANYINQELFGTPISQEWLEFIGLNLSDNIKQEAGYGAIQYFNAVFHPIFLYESLWSFAAFLVLFYLFNNRYNRFKPGDFFLIYIAQYSFIRFLLEFIRVEVTLVGDVNVSQAVTAALFVLSIGALVYRHRPGAPEYIERKPEPAVEKESQSTPAASEPQAETT